MQKFLVPFSGAMLPLPPMQPAPLQESGIHPLDNKLFNKLKEKAFERRPQLEKIIEQYGDMSLYEYATYYNRPYEGQVEEKRRDEFVSTFKEAVERLLGKEVAESCATQIKRTYRIATTDHHGPISEPGMVNADVHEAIPYLEGDEHIKNVVVLGCANVSFDNESFPRGLLFHSFANNQLYRNQLVFYPRAVRPCPVIFFPAYKEENIQNALKRIDAWEKEGVIKSTEKEVLTNLISEIYSTEDVLSQKYFSEQITKTNYKLWKKFTKSYEKAPNLVYIEQESLVSQLLLKFHMNEDTFIHRILFDPKYHELLLKYFDGILRGFSIKDKVGTYLFWALPKGQKYRVQLWRQGNYLVSDDGSYKVALTPEDIQRAISEKELIPSTLLSFLLLCFYYGLRLTGGTNQTTYLTQMKKAFIAMQEECGDFESIEIAKNVPTTDLSIAVQSLAFLQAPLLPRVPATGLDFILSGNFATLSIMTQIAKNLTVKETFYRALPDCYRWYYKEEERDPELSAITKEQVEKYLQIENKIVPSAKIT